MSGRIISGEEAQALLSATCEDPTPCTGPGCMGGCVEDQFKALMRLRDAAPDLAYTVDHQAATIADQGREIERLTADRRRLQEERDEILRRVRVVLAHFGVADCDDPLAALEEVPERADAVVDDAVAHANELALQVAALRAVIEGRTVAPTDAEIDAHEAAGGTWTCTTAGEWIFSDAGMDAEGARNLRGVLAADSWAKPRWWAHDANDTPCAWPSVSREPAR